MHDGHLLPGGEVQGECPSGQGSCAPYSPALWTARATGNRDSRRASVSVVDLARDSQSCRRSGKNCCAARRGLGQLVIGPVNAAENLLMVSIGPRPSSTTLN